MCPIAWDDGRKPPSPKAPPLHNTPTRSFVRLAGELLGVFVHWRFNRTLPCLGGKCPHCREGLPSRWAGYAPAVLYGRDAAGKPLWKPVVLYVPEPNREDFDQRSPLRGKVFELERLPQGAGKPLAVRFVEEPASPPPEWFDVRVALMKLWRYAEDSAVWQDPPVTQDDEPDAGEPPAVVKFRRPGKGGAA